MFTRTNISVALILFIVFFTVLCSFFGERGYFVSRGSKNLKDELNYTLEKKRAEVDLLKRKEQDKGQCSENEELLMVFPNSTYTPRHTYTDVYVQPSFKGLSVLAIFLISSSVSIIYLVICFFVMKSRRS